MRILLALSLFLSININAQTILIKNARIFNGVDPSLTVGHVYIKDGLIESVSKNLPTVSDETQTIDAKNKVLTPGFIDIHAHLAEQYPFKYEKYHPLIAGVYAGKAAEFYLLNGFTSIRGAGGTSPDMAKIIADNNLLGPRFFASGAYIGQTSGHGDFRLPH